MVNLDCCILLLDGRNLFHIDAKIPLSITIEVSEEISAYFGIVCDSPSLGGLQMASAEVTNISKFKREN